MKRKISLIIVLFAIILSSCLNNEKKYNNSDNEIILKAIKHPDTVNSSHRFFRMSTKRGDFWDKVYPVVTGIPDTLSNVKLYFRWIDKAQALFQAYKNGDVEKENFMNYYNWWGMDTVSCVSDYVKTFVIVATGYDSKGNKYYTLDSNNDYDLSDEVYYKLDSTQYSTMVHKVLYENHINNKIFTDSTWVALRGSYLQFCEYTETNFVFDTTQYVIKTYPSDGFSVRYGYATSFNIIHNETQEKLRLNQYCKLSEEYYKITASKDGRTIQLKHSPNALEVGSDQIGMPPFSFTAETLRGDSVNFPKDFHGKFVLLDFWATSCSPCVQEIKDYYVDIYNEYKDIFEIVGVADDKKSKLEEFVTKNNIDWVIIPDGELNIIEKTYQIYQYPTLFLINPEGKIIANGNELRGGRFRDVLKKVKAERERKN